jgi:hypothetical protein
VCACACACASVWGGHAGHVVSVRNGWACVWLCGGRVGEGGRLRLSSAYSWVLFTMPALPAVSVEILRDSVIPGMLENGKHGQAAKVGGALFLQ